MTAIKIPTGFKVTPEQFDELALSNRDVVMELTPKEEIIIMSPTGGTAGRKNFKLNVLFGIWAEQNGTGVGFDASTVFILDLQPIWS